jgi:hypothetical protein
MKLALHNQQPHPKGTGYVVLLGYLYSGFNTFLSALKGGELNPLNTNKAIGANPTPLAWNSAFLVAPKNFLGAPKIFLGQTKNLSGHSKNFLGQSKNLSGHSKNFSGQSKILLGQTKFLLGHSKNFSG